ncbi:hypothetical protein EDM53_03600 [Rickettsiales endosymbiont of Peranema trichophorum]|uniref:hypothetical protein n=1 Tax=Rickettsiales endosymbiont of Peranema trichophorum TaxID=2486577 RepID=UPI0010EED94B|nr:hypothetical protein [Rickettsiales endosymbiont of Peranema trichophorum]RZI46797.1 hypothetical protein EDM53_03600 [Rickettsiales endosymbiont of Peranema trichophorum]
MKARKLNIAMSPSDFKNFSKYLKQGKVEEFIAKFMAAHSNIERDDVLSLALDRAIKLRQPGMVKQILDIPHTSSILTTLNSKPYTPIAYVLNHCIDNPRMSNPTEGSTFAYVLKYLKEHKDQIPLIDLEGGELLSIRAGLFLPHWEVTFDEEFDYLKEHVLDYLYTQDSLNVLCSAFRYDFDEMQYLEECESVEGGSTSENNAATSNSGRKDTIGKQKIAGHEDTDGEDKPSIRSTEDMHQEWGDVAVLIGSDVRQKDGTVEVNDEEVPGVLFEELLGWISELPEWLQVYVLRSHPVERILEFIKSLESAWRIRLFEDGLELDNKAHTAEDIIGMIEEKAVLGVDVEHKPDENVMNKEYEAVGVLMRCGLTVSSFSVGAYYEYQEETAYGIYNTSISEVQDIDVM